MKSFDDNMDDMLKEIELGEEALVYIRKWLEGGGYTLAKATSSILLMRQKGRVITYLPREMDMDLALNFEGGFAHPQVPYLKGISSVIDHFARDYLIDNQKYIFVESFSIKSTSILDKEKLPYIYFKKTQAAIIEPYLFLRYSDSSNTYSLTKLKRARVYPFVAVFTKLPINMADFIVGQAVNLEILELLARQADYIVVDAYDGEGYLIWCRV
jgi:hypothetical protein